ncbi:MAG: TIGR02147 family protein [Bdellovibrionales bacterium]|nr:TIGR02147 family protein [Bdellovibrionales bacterium]
MFDYDNYKDYLNDELVKRVGVNRAYSLRAFAKSLGLSSGELSEVLRGVRKLSVKSAMKISKSLNLTSRETKHLLGLVNKEHGVISETLEDSEASPYKEVKMNPDEFAIVNDWYHFAILNLADCKDFEWSFAWIAKKLNITSFEVKVAIDKMIKVGLIKKINYKNGDVSYKVNEDYVMSAEGVSSQAVKNYHRQILMKAIDSLELQKIEERDITGIGMAIDEKDLAAIKKEISEFQDTLVEKYSKGKKERVYQLEVALFALSEKDI